MPVVSKMRVQGDADTLAAAIREHIAPVAERLAEKHGGLANIVAKTDDGILMINVWETEEGRHAMAEEPEIQAAVRAAGFPAPAFKSFEVLELHVSERISAFAAVRA
jgi:hypothetical protein